MLQIDFEPLCQPGFVDPTIGERLQQKLSRSRQWTAPSDPIVDRTLRAARDEGQVLVANVVVVKELLEVFHCSPQWSGLS